MQVKAGIAALLAFALSAAVYFLIVLIGNALIEKYYLSEEDCGQRQIEYVKNFEKYTAEQNVASDNFRALKEWCKEKKYVYLSIYRNNELYYETDGTFDATYELTGSVDNTMDSFLYPVKFIDGTFGVYIYESSENKYYNMVKIIGLAAALAVLIVTILISNRRVIMKVIRLSNDIKEVRDGNLRKEIASKGNDEFAQLSSDVNDMRMSIIKHYESEQEAWQANNELLTSISHDIRTPLTALIGYSEILVDGQFESPEEMKQYAETCREKAYQLKDLTDTLFRYFLVFGNADVTVRKETYLALILLEQLLGEHIIYLRQKGFLIQSDFPNIETAIETDISLLKRVFDNVFFNIEKYADKSREITVCIEQKEKQVVIIVSNFITPRVKKTETTKIGVKTCEKIMSLLDGKFESLYFENTYSAVIKIPVSV